MAVIEIFSCLNFLPWLSWLHLIDQVFLPIALQPTTTVIPITTALLVPPNPQVKPTATTVRVHTVQQVQLVNTQLYLHEVHTHKK